jgi:hypothetical protein
MRFERSDSPVFGSKLFSRNDINARLKFTRAMDAGAFLARLWAHFGPASPRDAGFEYHLRDRETGLTFTAYAGPSGPSYGGDLMQRNALRRVIAALEELLETTEPVDCAIAYLAEVEYGGGIHVLGWKNGTSFDVLDRRQKKPGAVERRSPRA